MGRAHGGADGAAAKPWSLGEHPPSACGVCEREPSAYETGAVTKGFGS
ncbi:aldehyde dehydrogenase [Streptomyces sp. BpilaLS-43]|nr:aldehyde dehydrogenase [Streptomyces sp. BpilaLS-43]